MQQKGYTVSRQTFAEYERDFLGPAFFAPFDVALSGLSHDAFPETLSFDAFPPSFPRCFIIGSALLQFEPLTEVNV